MVDLDTFCRFVSIYRTVYKVVYCTMNYGHTCFDGWWQTSAQQKYSTKFLLHNISNPGLPDGPNYPRQPLTKKQKKRALTQGEVGKPCLSVYHGESGYSCYHRGRGHLEGLNKKQKKNALWRHSLLYHGGDTAQFSMSVSAVHPTTLSMKLREGFDIVSEERDILLNSTLEFLQGAVPHDRRQWGLQAQFNGPVPQFYTPQKQQLRIN